MSIQQVNEEIFNFVCETHETALENGITPSPILTLHAVNTVLDGGFVILDQAE